VRSFIISAFEGAARRVLIFFADGFSRRQLLEISGVIQNGNWWRRSKRTCTYADQPGGLRLLWQIWNVDRRTCPPAASLPGFILGGRAPPPPPTAQRLFLLYCLCRLQDAEMRKAKSRAFERKSQYTVGWKAAPRPLCPPAAARGSRRTHEARKDYTASLNVPRARYRLPQHGQRRNAKACIHTTASTPPDGNRGWRLVLCVAVRSTGHSGRSKDKG